MTPSRPPQPVCEFWIGRAGAGKTHGCLGAIAGELIRSPRGQPLILLVPEQATAQAERRLATWPGVLGGFTRARVFSFVHLTGQALLSLDTPQAQMLGETGRVLLLRRALRQCRDRLRMFGSSAGQPGMAERLSGTLTELQRYGWRPEAIESWLASRSEQERQADPLARKLGDLLELWRACDDLLARGGWSDLRSRHAAQLDAIRTWPALEDCRVWIDGFASFTTLELELLEAILKRSQGAVVALCVDGNALSVPATTRPPVGPERLFETTIQTLHTLESRLRDAGWETRRVRLPLDGQPTRFGDTPALAHLEREVLGRLRPQPFVAPASTSLVEAPIQIVEAADRRAEVEAVARRIVMLCRRPDPPQTGQDGPGLTWRQVGVLTRDLAPYAALVRDVFARFEIPCFVDRQREMIGHPLARLLLTALDVLRGDWAGRAVIHHLKSGLSGLRDRDLAARLENHILSVDPDRRGWIEPLADTPALRAAWRLAEAPLRGLERDLRAGRNPAHALWSLLERLQAGGVLEGWIADAQAAGDEELAQLHEQAWRQTVAWLEELGAFTAADPGIFVAAGDDAGWREQLDELTALIETALASTRARLIPPTLNQVTVGSVDRSRTPELNTLFVLGLNEGEFPRLWSPDAILGDAERETLSAEGRALGPDSAARRLQEQYLAYIALTRPGRRLILCRPLTGDDGKPANPSPVFSAVAQAFQGAPRWVVGTHAGDDDATLGLRPEEWNLRLAAAVGHLGPPERAGDLAALMAAGDPLDQPALSDRHRRGTLAGRRDAWRPSPVRLERGLAATLLAARGSLRVTEIERYGACPFQLFAQSILRLTERTAAGLSPMDLGTLRHEALERLFREMRDPDGLDWGTLDLGAADRAIDDHLRAALANPRTARALRAGSMQTVALDVLGRDLKLTVRGLRRAAARGDLRQVAAEWSFGEGGELTVQTGGPALSIRGQVDRIDACRESGEGTVYLLFDFKSRRRRFSLTRLLAGIDLQLASYALALRQSAPERRPAGGSGPPRIGGLFYWPLDAPLLDGTPGETGTEEPVGDDWFERCRPEGIFAADIAPHLDRQVMPGEKSPVFRFSRNRDGSLSDRTTHHWESDRFDRLLDVARRRLTDAIEGLQQGRIAPHPALDGKTAECDRCPYATVCRRNDPCARVGFRRLTPYNRRSAYALLDDPAQGGDPER